MLQLEATSVLDVPLIKQPDRSKECGLATLAMILDYHQVPVTLEELRIEIAVQDWGTAMPQLGLFLIRRGFRVNIITMHPALFDDGSDFSSQSELLAYFQALQPQQETVRSSLELNYFIRFIQAGGQVVPRIPDDEVIEEEIRSGQPLIAPVSHRCLFKSGQRPRFSGHYNVITGIDSQHIYVNDPDWEPPFGGRHRHAIKKYLYAIYANARPGLDNASLMTIAKTG